METVCKTRACLVCRVKVQNRFKMLVEYGILTLGRSLFITVTYAAGTGKMRDALYVSQTWNRLLAWWRRSYEEVSWVKVVELTKKNQPHLHLIASSESWKEKASCQPGRHAYDARWRNRPCGCFEHVISKQWFRITGDSWVVKVKEVASSGMASSYMAKYFSKDFLYAEGRKALGFERSWSRSRSWPVDKLQLKATLEKQWLYVYFSKKSPAETVNAVFLRRMEMAERRLLERVGTDLAFELALKKEKLAVGNRLRKAVLSLGS
jgi:hypothetical protein